MARILSNLILVGAGLPPIFINDSDKEIYNRLITDVQSYGGPSDLFHEFFGGLVVRSLKMILEKAAS